MMLPKGRRKGRIDTLFALCLDANGSYDYMLWPDLSVSITKTFRLSPFGSNGNATKVYLHTTRHFHLARVSDPKQMARWQVYGGTAGCPPRERGER